MRKETQKSLQVNSQSWLNAIILHKHKHQGEGTASETLSNAGCQSSSRHINSPHLYLCCFYVILLMGILLI